MNYIGMQEQKVSQYALQTMSPYIWSGHQEYNCTKAKILVPM